jgi:HemY protein
MKWPVSIIVILLLATGVALLANSGPGYVLLSHGPWKVEMTLTVAVVVLLAAFTGIYYLIRFTVNAWRLPRRMRGWRIERQTRKARATLIRGLIHLEEGQWQAAEQQLIQYVDHADTPLLHYLAAARAAQKQAAHERRDNYLSLAHQSTPGADIAVGLTQAELQLSHRQLEQALATLMHLRQLAPKHNYVLKLLMKLYVELRDWRQLLELLPTLLKDAVLSKTQADALEVRAYAELLSASGARSYSTTVLHELWNSMPKRLRTNEDVLISYASELRVRGEEAACEVLLREALKKNWHEKAAHLYGLVAGQDAAMQLVHAETWLKAHPQNPTLLLTLGRLARRNRLWGKARSYLESSLATARRTETYQELGTLLEEMSEPGAALENYRNGLRMANNALPHPSSRAETKAPALISAPDRESAIR